MYHNTSFSIFCHCDTSTSSAQALGGIYLTIKRFFTSLRSVQNDKIPIMSDNGQSNLKIKLKAISELTSKEIKQTLNYLTASKNKIDLLVSCGEDNLIYKK